MANDEPGKKTNSIDDIAVYVRQLAKGGDAAAHMIANSYVAELQHADKQQSRWRTIYYQYRGFVIAASAVITILTGLNLQGNTSFTIRVTTVVLGGLITVASGLLELLQVNNRWRLYRVLRARLEAITWRIAAQKPEPLASSALATVGQQFVTAMQDFEHYMFPKSPPPQMKMAANQKRNATVPSKRKSIHLARGGSPDAGDPEHRGERHS